MKMDKKESKQKLFKNVSRLFVLAGVFLLVCSAALLLRSESTGEPEATVLEDKYIVSDPEKNLSEAAVIRMDTAASEAEEDVLTSQKWLWEGYRLSDTWLYYFYEDGTFQAVSAVGIPDSYGTYDFDGSELLLYNAEGNMYDTLRYDGTLFTSSIRRVYTGIDYVDADGIYHEKPSREGTLEISYEGFPWLETGAEETEESGEYILPDSSDRLYTEEELAGFSDWELTLARNESYARHGRLFNTPEIQTYFDSCSWYQGRITPEEFDGHESEYLNATELENVMTIYNYQGQPEL